MSNISEKIYLQRLNTSSPAVKDYLSSIFSNTSFIFFLEKHKNTKLNIDEIADNLRNEVLLLLTKIISLDNFTENIVEILNLTPENAEEIMEEFFTTCIPQNIQDSLNISKRGENKLEDAKLSEKTEPTHISHQDLLSEIENPTPSISTTTDFQNRAAQVSVQSTQNSQAVNVSKASSTTSTTSTASTSTSINSVAATNSTQNPSLHSSDPSVTPYTNPALHIATKLDQNLGGPTSSIPKDVYVSKKPDPYHEPVDL